MNEIFVQIHSYELIRTSVHTAHTLTLTFTCPPALQSGNINLNNDHLKQIKAEGETELTIHTGAMLALHHIEQKSKNLTTRNSILTLSATNVH